MACVCPMHKVAPISGHEEYYNEKKKKKKNARVQFGTVALLALSICVENCRVIISLYVHFHVYCSIFNLSHCVKTRSQGCNAVTTRLKRAVIPLQPALALMLSTNSVISRVAVFFSSKRLKQCRYITMTI